MKRADGYMQGGEYIVTWVFGHLFSLRDIEYYNPNPDGGTRWSVKNIPCFPEKFSFELKRDTVTKKVDGGVYKQFETIKGLINREDVDMVINAGDADREGEIIVRICVEEAKMSGKSFKRLWLPDQTKETILKALDEMKDESQYMFLHSLRLQDFHIQFHPSSPKVPDVLFRVSDQEATIS